MIAPPRWPADATLLREVLAWARAEGWRRPPNHAHPAFDSVPIFGAWTRGPIDDAGLGDEYVCFVHDLSEISDDVSGPGMFGDLCDGVPLASADQAINLLVALKVLPVRFSSAYRMGREALADEVHACAEFGEGSHAFFAMAGIMPVLGDALTYWSDVARSDEVETVVGSRLDGLLDREPFARRRQTGDAVEAVMDGLAAHLARLLKEQEAKP